MDRLDRKAGRIFLFAGIYGILALLPQYFLEERNGRDFPPPINHPEYFYGFIGVALAWQVAFLLIARDPRRYRVFMLPSILEKLTFAIATIVLFARGRIHALVLGFGLVDLILAALFFAAYRLTADRKS